MDTDRDILIAVKTTVDEIHREMTAPGGKVPILAEKVDEHSQQLSYYKGALALVGLLLLAFGTALAAHLLGGHQ